MEHNRIGIAQFIGGTKNCYSDYEELAFMSTKKAWVKHLFKYVLDIGGAYARDNRHPKDFMDLVFFSSVHVLSAFDEVHGRVSERTVRDVVETATYMLDVIQSNDHVVRSSIDWSDPDAYANWIQEG